MKNDSHYSLEPQANRKSHGPPSYKKQITETFKSSKIETSDSFSSLNEAMIKIETGRSTENETGLDDLQGLEDSDEGENGRIIERHRKQKRGTQVERVKQISNLNESY